MKNKFVFISFLLSLLIASSCSVDNLDIPQKGVLDFDDFYKTEQDALSALTAVYGDLTRTMARGLVGGQSFNYSPYIQLWNMPSDDIHAAGEFRGDNDFGGSINEFRFDVQNETVASMYRSFYAVIYTANVLIEQFDQNDPNDNIRRIVAEARVWRAWCHMMLAIGWGSPPLMDRIIPPDEFPSNTPFEEVMDFVIKEFNEAATHIPSKPSKFDRDATVRLCKEAVYAFMGKAQVYAGKFGDAVTNLKNNVIDKDLYDLVPGNEMKNLFHGAGNYSVEKVFEFNVLDNSALTTNDWGVNALWQHNDYWGWRGSRIMAGGPREVKRDGWGGVMPAGEFARALIANDGIDSYRRKGWLLRYDEVLYDLTWESDFNTDGTPKNLTLAEKRADSQRGTRRSAGVHPNAPAAEISDPLYGCEGYFMLKRMAMEADHGAPTRTSYYIKNHVIMRYAEVLLLYAEACVMTNQNLPQALELVNKIQIRAGSQTITQGQLTLQDVKNEKRFEMWLEGTRFVDLVRWGDAFDVLKDQCNNTPHFQDNFRTGDHGTWDNNDWEITWRNYNEGSVHGFQKGKHELFPFPFWATSRNPNLVQNAGW